MASNYEAGLDIRSLGTDQLIKMGREYMESLNLLVGFGASEEACEEIRAMKDLVDEVVAARSLRPRESDFDDDEEEAEEGCDA